MKKIILMVTLFVGMGMSFVYGKSIPFRSGEILNAEYSATAPEIKDFDKLLLKKEDFKKFAVVYIRLSNKRTISIFDYKLAVGDKLYSAIAIQENYHGFKYTIDNLTAKNRNDIFSLLFFVNDDMHNGNYKLHATFQPVGKSVVQVPFVSAKNGLFSESTMIKFNGNF